MISLHIQEFAWRSEQHPHPPPAPAASSVILAVLVYSLALDGLVCLNSLEREMVLLFVMIILKRFQPSFLL